MIKKIDVPLRLMTPEEEASVARAWELSAECAVLQERQRALKEKIQQKAGKYSSRG
jgi:hypothetical protein